MKNLRLQILDRYIIRKFLGTYIFTISMIIVIVIIFDLAEKIQDFLAAHLSFWEILTGYYLNFIPYFINQFSGLFTFISVIFFTSKLAYDTEIVAILSSGVSFRRLMWPYFVASLAIATLSLSLNLFVIPEANKNRIEFEKKTAKPNPNDQYKTTYVFRQIEPNTFAFIKNYDQAAKRAGYLAIETYDGGKITSSLEAENVSYDQQSGRWTAPKYITRDFVGESENLVKVTHPLDTVIQLVADELGEVESLAQTLNSVKLSKFIKQQRAKGSDMVVLFEIESYGRYAYPISTFILTLIGVSLSSQKVRGGRGMQIGVGIGLCFSYIVLMRFTGEFAKTGIMPTILAMWFPNILYAIIGIYLYRKAPK